MSDFSMVKYRAKRIENGVFSLRNLYQLIMNLMPPYNNSGILNH